VGIYRNWRDPKEYEFRSNVWPGIEEEFWAWEFLRRNINYQKDWNKELKFFQSSSSEPIGNIESSSFFLEPQQNDCRKKWGIYYFINPNTDNPDMLFFDAGYGRIYRESGHVILQPGQVAAVFDLQRPIKPQFKQIDRGLKEWKRRFDRNGIIQPTIPRKYNKDDWGIQLRVLDAKTSGIETKEIADELFPGYSNKYPDKQANRHVIDSHAAAKKMVDRGYLKIIFNISF
jgi:hypothetical protein